MAKGDLTQQISVRSKDELGQVADLFNTFSIKINDTLLNLGENAEKVTLLSCDLLSVSECMNEGSENLSSQAKSVANAAYELSAAMDLISSTVERTTGRLENISASASLLRSAFKEMLHHRSETRRISSASSELIDHTLTRVTHLSNASKEIIQVTNVITEIVDQTKLLALNATIEASRAGQYGKGFLVVANEIKQLADQTVNAIEDIQNRIMEIQKASGFTKSDVNSFTHSIKEFTNMIGLIVGSFEEQSTHTDSVSGNIQKIFDQIGNHQ